MRRGEGGGCEEVVCVPTSSRCVSPLLNKIDFSFFQPFLIIYHPFGYQLVKIVSVETKKVILSKSSSRYNHSINIATPLN
jgi:hypothetical protein